MIQWHQKDLAMFVSECPSSQHVKVNYKRPSGLAKYIEIPTWKWDDINMDILIGFPHSQKRYDSVWVIMDNQIRSFPISEDYFYCPRLSQVVYPEDG